MFERDLASLRLVAAGAALVAVLGIGLGGCADGSEAGSSASASASTSTSTSTSTPSGATVSGDGAGSAADAAVDETCGHAPEDTYCGVTEAELHDLNMRYADRTDFAGDPAEAAATVGAVRHLLAPLIGAVEPATEGDLREALVSLGDVQTSTNAVRLDGTAFAVAVDGGCVFGAISDGELRVEIAGYINDGGCLASYGH